jgi:DNA-binding LytR/AlgR family response regulator
MVDTQDVIYLEAADKYVRIVVRQPPPGVGELLIRTPLKELLPRLAADQFWQIHRSVVVNARAIERVSRQQQKLRVHLRDHPDVLDVSRMHAHLFKAL